MTIGAGALLAGRYRLIEQIGRGGFGTVFRGTDLDLGRDVAVKLMRPDLPDDEAEELLARFDREARVMAMIKHPNIVMVYDRGRHEGGSFVVMEFLPGPDLGVLQRRDGLLPIADVVHYGRQIAAGLECLHGHATPVVHRDLKPQNLILDHGGVLKICDFGVAALPTAGLTRYTMTPAAIGTDLYMSPEQCRGATVTPASDIYSFGTVLYSLLAGGPPFSNAGGFDACAHRIVTEPPEPMPARRPDVPPPLATLIHAMLAKPAADRPDATTVRHELQRIAETTTAPPSYAAPAPAPEGTGRPGRRDGGEGEEWARAELAAAEHLLGEGRHDEAHRRFAETARHLDTTGDGATPSWFAAEFGRIRAAQALGGGTETALRWVRLERRARETLGPAHPLTHAIQEYGGITDPAPHPTCDPAPGPAGDREAT